jgi:hypothetical protein
MRSFNPAFAGLIAGVELNAPAIVSLILPGLYFL